MAILFAVVVVVLIGGINDWQKEKQFRAMEDDAEKTKLVIFRGGEQCHLDSQQIVVGDLISLKVGDIVPCDGVFVTGTGVYAYVWCVLCVFLFFFCVCFSFYF